jgi:hypothetical protein
MCLGYISNTPLDHEDRHNLEGIAHFVEDAFHVHILWNTSYDEDEVLIGYTTDIVVSHRYRQEEKKLETLWANNVVGSFYWY